MDRSSFLKNSLLASGALLAGNAVLASTTTSCNNDDIAIAPGKPFNMNYGPHDGMFKNSAGANFLDQIQFMYDQGFRSIEDNGMSSRTPAEQEKIGSLLAKLNMAMGVWVLVFGGCGGQSICAGPHREVDIFG
jgi:hydroxypyruvate isomerase